MGPLYAGQHPAGLACLAKFGAPLDDLTPDDLNDPIAILQIGVPPGRIDIIMSIEGVDFAEAWSRRTVFKIGSLPVPTISRNDLITAKRQAGRPQDLADVETLENSPYNDLPPAQ